MWNLIPQNVTKELSNAMLDECCFYRINYENVHHLNFIFPCWVWVIYQLKLLGLVTFTHKLQIKHPYSIANKHSTKYSKCNDAIHV